MTVTINNCQQRYIEQMMLLNKSLGPPKKRGLIRRTVGATLGAVGGGIKGALGGGVKGAVTGGVGGSVLGGPAAPVTGTLGAAAGGVGGGIIGGIRGMGKGIRHGARKFATPKVTYNEGNSMRTAVTVNNSEQLKVEQQMLVNQLVDNGLLRTGGEILKGVGKVGKAAAEVGVRRAGKSLKRAGKAAKSAKADLKTGYRVGKNVSDKATFGAVGRSSLPKSIKSGAMVGMGVGKAKKFATSKAGKMTGMGAGIAGTAGAGVAVGRASNRKRK